MIFSFVSELNSCDIQRFISQNMYVKHTVAVIGFFFMIVLLDDSITVLQAWGITLFVYSVYYLSTRSKLFFTITVVLLLVVHENLHISYKRSPQEETHKREMLMYGMNAIKILIGITIILGISHYFIRQKRSFGKDFSPLLFFLGTRKCQET